MTRIRIRLSRPGLAVRGHARRLGRPPGRARRRWPRPSAALGEDIGALIHAGPKEALELTTNTQPVMLTAAIACYRAWRAEGGAEPAAVAGHSLGEYSALVAAGALTLADALPLVRFRAQAMQQAVPVGAGAMAAILGLDAAAVAAVCAAVAAATGEVVAPANFNDPKQTVIAGSKAGVDRACELLKAAGAKRALLLAGVGAVPLVADAARPPRRCASGCAAVAIRAPRIPVVNNIDVAVADRPRRHPRRAVPPGLRPGALGRGRAGAARARPRRTCFECGPGKVLAGLVRRIDAETGLDDACSTRRAWPKRRGLLA